ncbi:HEAT repeat domain-containing protein [Methanoculleus sp.]|uniref:HEAT repeat domain-containing protein n=1 Tax=Methanoculleus sp. TaxID=90427 RepID=UPI002FC5EA66
MKRLRQDEIDYLAHPERFTFDYFRAATLDPLPEAAALGIADEELLNYYENRYHHDARFVLRLDPNNGHYRDLEAWVAGAAYRIVGERDPAAARSMEADFTTFRVGSVDALHPYPEIQKIQVLKKIALELRMEPGVIDEIASLFSVGSSVFAMELFTRLAGSGRLKEFQESLFRPEDELARLAARPMLLYSLWDHQKRALSAWLEAGGRGILEMATATGKTMVGLAAAEKLFSLHGSLRVLVLAHSRALLDQWRREAIDKLGFVGDPGGSYRRPLGYDGRFVIEFETLQKVYRNPGAYSTDLLIVDEVHHGAGLQFRRALDLSCRWKMGLSATVEGSERGQVLDRHLGRTVYTFTLKEARDEGVVPEFDLYVHRTFLDIAEDEEFRDLSEQIMKLLNQINARHQRLIQVLSGHRFSRFESLADFVNLMRNSRYSETSVPEEWLKLIGLVYRRRWIIHRSSPRIEQAIDLIRRLGNQKKCVVFSMDIATCERIYRAVKGTVSAYRVHSGMDREDVRKTLAAFRNCTTGVLIAPKMLDEGIDVPDAEIGINVASARTRLQLVQRMGRILRNRPGKRPVFHHFVALPRNFVAAEDSFAYQNDLAWIQEIALRLGIALELYDPENHEVLELEQRSEETVRSYYRARDCIVTDDFGTIHVRKIVDSIRGEARERLGRLLATRSGGITDEEWLLLLREAYGEEPTINASSLRWLLVIAGRDPQALRSLLLMGERDAPSARLPGQALDMQEFAGPGPGADAADRRVADLITVLRSAKDQKKRESAAQALTGIGLPAVEPLVAALSGADGATKRRIVSILGAVGSPRSVYPISGCLRDLDPGVRKSAADALGAIGDPRARLVLTKAQRDRNPAVKAAVRKALERLREER